MLRHKSPQPKSIYKLCSYYSKYKQNEPDHSSITMETKMLAIPILHPCNTIQVTQTGFKFWWRTRILSRAISSPTAFFCIWCCGCIDIQVFRKKTLKDTSRFTCFKIKYLQIYELRPKKPKHQNYVNWCMQHLLKDGSTRILPSFYRSLMRVSSLRPLSDH